MKILQGGAPKCGNFWLYQILQQLLEKGGHSTTSFISQQPIYTLAREWDLNYPSQASIDVLDITDLQYSYRISSIYRMPVEDIRGYVAQTNHVWTHSPICKRSPELLPLFDKKVYILRDPRDRALSAARYYCSDYMLKYYPQPERDPQRYLQQHFDELMQEWVWHVYDHLRLQQEQHIHICFYEGFLLDFQQELGRLLQYLGLELSLQEREQLQQDMSFSSMQKENPKHLQKGASGYWMDKLTEEQAERALVIAGPLLQYLGYPLRQGEPMSYSPQPPHLDFGLLKEQILEAQQELYVMDESIK